MLLLVNTSEREKREVGALERVFKLNTWSHFTTGVNSLVGLCPQIGSLISKLKDSLTAKQKELTAFKDKHNIHVKGEKESPPEEDVKAADKSSGVLVAQDSSQGIIQLYL